MKFSDSKSFDAELGSVNEWINRATKALLSFADLERGVFWRDNDKKAAFEQNGNNGKTTKAPGESPTSTRRSFIALIAALHSAGEENAKRHEVIDSECALHTAKAVATLYFDRAIDDVRNPGGKAGNAFMDAQLLNAVALLKTLKAIDADLAIDADAISARVSPVLSDVLTALSKFQGVPMRYDEDRLPHADDEAPHRHDFITLYAVRGLDAHGICLLHNVELGLQKRLRDDVLRQLGYKLAGVSSRFDASELAFTVTLLNRFPTPDTEPLTAAAVDAIVQAQLESAAWPPARPVVYSADDNRVDILHIASFDVALALSYLLRAQAHKQSVPFHDKLLDALGRMFLLVKSSFRITTNAEGWCNDHARSENLVESWATAVVVMFLTQYRELLLEARQAEILEKYHAEPDRPRASASVRWRDMSSVLPQFDAMNRAELAKFSDPTDNRDLHAAVAQKFFDPIRESWLHKPAKAASLILYGLPGTRKTSLVERLAEALRWPLLTITPPNFLQRGLDGFEAVAANVFEDLFRLRRVVVFFDECEDFFKKRPIDQKLESRTIGAFITAGMLPRLQKLRSRKWVIFVVATNSSLIDLDEAVTRPGRFDFAYEMRHPTAIAAKRYVVERLREESKGDLVPDAEAALDMVDFSENLPSFTILEHLVQDLLDGELALRDVPHIVAHIDALRNRAWPENLVSP